MHLKSNSLHLNSSHNMTDIVILSPDFNNNVLVKSNPNMMEIVILAPDLYDNVLMYNYVIFTAL